MRVNYKNKRLEKVLIGVNALAAVVVAVSFVMLVGGFKKPLLPEVIVYAVQIALLCIFVVEKIVRLFNAISKVEFWRANWFEIPLLLALGVAVFGAGRWFAPMGAEAAVVRHFAVGVYLLLQVATKLCR
ncbi:MAG: hypothetical protein ACYSR9_01805, partial [Planctomycetota bacterium]